MLLFASLFLSSPVWILPVILSGFSQEIYYSRYSSGHNYSQTFPFHLWELVCFKSLNAFAFSWAMEASYGLWGFLCQHTPPSLGHTASPCTPSRLAMWNFIGTSKITGEQGNEHLALPSGTTEEPDWHCYCSCGPRETRQRASGTSRAVQSQAKSCSMMERGLISSHCHEQDLLHPERQNTQLQMSFLSLWFVHQTAGAERCNWQLW